MGVRQGTGPRSDPVGRHAETQADSRGCLNVDLDVWRKHRMLLSPTDTSVFSDQAPLSGASVTLVFPRFFTAAFCLAAAFLLPRPLFITLHWTFLLRLRLQT